MTPHSLGWGCTSRSAGRGHGALRVAALLAAALLGLAGPGAQSASAHGDGSYPRTYNLDLRNTINAVADSRYDLLVHSEVLLNNVLDSLRALNPSIQRLVHDSWYIYYNAGPSGFPADWGPYDANDPVYGWYRRYWDLLNDNNWWLYAVDSSGTRYHAAMTYLNWCGNFSSACPKNAQGQRLCDVYADFLIDNLVAQRHTDGVFFDFCNDGYGWMNWYMWGNCPGNCNDPSLPRTPDTKFKTAFDCNVDGIPDPVDSVDAWWGAGMRIIMARLRQRMGSQFVMVGNGQHHFTDMNGAMIERFPFILGSLDPSPNPSGYLWHDNMFSPKFGYLAEYEQIFSQPRHDLIDAVSPGGTTTEPDRTADRERFKRLTLGSALLGNGYHGVRGAGATATTTWWEPEWNLHLGWPLGPATSYVVSPATTLWHRVFDRGYVWVNPSGWDVAQNTDHPAIPAWDAVIAENAPETTQSVPPTGLRLEAPRPNPAAAGTAIDFLLPAAAPASLLLFDVHGRMVKEIWSGLGTGSLQTAVWDGTTDPGYVAPAGIYFATLFAQGKQLQRRLVRLN